MRNAFAKEITRLAASNPKVVLLSGDIGNRLFNDYKAQCAERFFNCGVAEANMTGMAAGMAMCGLRPVTYTITPFNTLRCMEQIRVDICYQNLPVTIVGVGAGLSYAGLGATHQSCEDIAMLRSLPNMTVLCPGDAVEVSLAARAAVAHDGPVYIRIGKKNEPVVHQTEPAFTIGKGIVVRDGSEVCLLSTGNTLPVAMDAARELHTNDISAQVVSMHTVKPLDTDLLKESFSRFGVVATIEEHSIIGGFGSGVAEWLADTANVKGKLLRFGTPDAFMRSVGNQQNARQIAGLTATNIYIKVLEALKAQSVRQ